MQQEISTLKGWVTFTATLPGMCGVWLPCSQGKESLLMLIRIVLSYTPWMVGGQVRKEVVVCVEYCHDVPV